MCCPCRRTLKGVVTDTMHWLCQVRTMHQRQVLRLCRHTTWVVTCLIYETPKTKRPELKIPEKLSAVSKIHRCWWMFEKSNHHGSGTSLSASTVGPDNRIRTSVWPYHSTAFIMEIQYDRQNRPGGKFCQDDGSLWPRRAPGLIDRTMEKVYRICAIRGVNDCWHHDGFKRDHPSVTYVNVQQIYQGLAKSSYQPEDMGKFKIFIQQSHREQRKEVITSGKGGYTVVVQNIYSGPPPPPEEHHEAIDHINTMFRGIQMQSHDMGGLAQANAVLTR